MSSPTDNVLTMTARFDGSQLKAGLAGAAQAVTISVTQMGSSFTTANVAATQQTQQLQQQVTKLGSAFNTTTVTATQSLQQLQQQVIQLQTQVTVLTAKIQKMGTRTVGATTNARLAVRGLGEELGIHMPRFISTFIGTLPGVGAAMSAAFSIVAVVGIVQIVAQLIKEFLELGIAASKAGDAMGVAYGKLASDNEMANDELRVTNAELDKQLAMLYGHKGSSTLGLELAKNAVAADKFAKHIDEAGTKLEELSKKGVTSMGALASTFAQAAGLTDKWAVTTTASERFIAEAMQHLNDVADKGKEIVRQAGDAHAQAAAQVTMHKNVEAAVTIIIAQLNDRLTTSIALSKLASNANVDFTARTNELKAAISGLNDVMYQLALIEKQEAEQARNDKAQAAIDSAQKQIAAEQSLVTAKKTAMDAQIVLNEQMDKSDYAHQVTSYYEEISALRAQEKLKTDVEIAALQQRNTLLAKEHKATGKDVRPETNTNDAAIIAARLALQTKLSEMDVEELNHTREQNQAISLAMIEGRKAAAEAVYVNETESAKALYELHRIDATQEAAMLTDAENKRTVAMDKALHDRLQLANLDKDKNAAVIVTLNNEIESLTIAHETKLKEISTAGARARIEDQRKELEESMQAAEKKSNIMLESTERDNNYMLESGRETLRKWNSDQQLALATWYETQHNAMQRAATFARETFGETSTEYKQTLDKMEELDQQYLQKKQTIDRKVESDVRKVYNTITNDITGEIKKWTQHQETFKQASANVWNDLVSMAISKILQMGEEYVFEHVIMAAAHALFNTQVQTQDQIAAAAKAAQVAVNNADNVAEASSAAAVAAANTFAWYSAVNPPIAPAMAMLAYSEVMTYAGMASYNDGGIVSKLHEGEMVLPKHISNWVQNAATTSSHSSSQYSSMRMSYSPTISLHGNASKADAKAMFEEHKDVLHSVMNAGIRSGAVKVPR